MNLNLLYRSADEHLLVLDTNLEDTTFYQGNKAVVCSREAVLDLRDEVEHYVEALGWNNDE